MLVPVGFGVGLTSITLGLSHACAERGLNVRTFKPIYQPRRQVIQDENTEKFTLSSDESLPMAYVEQQLSEGLGDVVMEQIVERFNRIDHDHDVVIIEGLIPTTRQPYAGRINRDIARALSAEIVLVAAPDNDTDDEFEDRIEVSAETYGGIHNKRVIGCIINKINAPDKDVEGLLPKENDKQQVEKDYSKLALFKRGDFRLLGQIPWSINLLAPRVKDIANYLGATIINAGDMNHRRIRSISFCARSVPNLVSHLQPNRLIVTPGDRSDIIIATCLSALNGVKVGALLLTNGYHPEPQVMSLCEQSLEAGLPVLSVPWDTFRTSRHIINYNPIIPADDEQRLNRVKQFVADRLNDDWLQTLLSKSENNNIQTPAAFRYLLTQRAAQANKLIVLPEGEEPRTIKAAAICAERGIARCQLLGNKDEIHRIAAHQGIVLPDNIIITDPEDIRENYVAPLVKLRESKGMTDVLAREQLKDNVMLGTMMLQQGHVDGLVSGAVHTTANTIRPALQLIKTAPGNSIVSSIFFMLLPEQVLVYGDCAINPDPNAEQLAEIAIQSADSAQKFGISPKVAMISYSTGTSGQGADVDKVAQATAIVKQRRPDIIVDGPLQYDAAAIEQVGRQKAPNSPVAGQANVFIFPDLNTGNTTYKAVQRSANLVSIGPMLQGLNKPVNDLSRGALVDDIVYTIALTAIQAI
jgi:phosphate acetyltransferase